MKNILKIFTITTLTFGTLPLFAANTTNLIEKINSAKNPMEAKQAYLAAAEAITKMQEYNSVSQADKNKAIADAKRHAGLNDLSDENWDFESNTPEEETPDDVPAEVLQYDCEHKNNGKWIDGECVTESSNEESANTENDSAETASDTSTDEEKAKALAEKQQAYDDAKATEQSKGNRTLTALTTAATGIGGMQLAQGLAEQKADKAAEQDMAAYIATMRCTYGDGKSVKAGAEEIELPGGNDANLMKLRNEYFALANDLKERKTALGMKPGIESEEILDKAELGLYDDENVGITSGAYSSIYRAQMLGSNADQEQIDAAKKTSKNRVIGGAVAAGVGVVGGMVGDSLINGKLGEKIKELKDKRNSTKENKETINELKSGLKSAGMSNTDKLDLSKFDMTELSGMISNTDFSQLNLNGKDATKDINTSNSKSLTSSLEGLLKTK